MSIATFFVQECPTCGRRVQIRVEHLGKPLACQHCQGTFIAVDPSGARGETLDRGSALLQRANELLDSVAKRQLAARPSLHQ